MKCSFFELHWLKFRQKRDPGILHSVCSVCVVVNRESKRNGGWFSLLLWLRSSC